MFTLIVLFLLPCSHIIRLFSFFWNHEEKTNFIAYDKVKFSENFLIQEFLNQYISVFTISIYFFILLLIIKKSQNKYWLALPFWIVNSDNKFFWIPK